MKHYLLSILFSLSCICLILQAKESESELLTKRVREEAVQFVNFMFTDLIGNCKAVTVPAHYVSSSLKNNISFDGSSIPGCARINESDMVLKPDINSFSITPWIEGTTKTARVICDIYISENEPYKSDPRYILKKTIEQANAMGYEFYVGPEIEFFIFKDLGEPRPTEPCDTKRYFDIETDGLLQGFKHELLNTLHEQNIIIEKFHHEVGPGQHEVAIKYDNALNIADQITLTKHIITTLAQKNALHATFMPKPILGQNGSGMHLHFSLYDVANSCNAFYDANDSLCLSQTAKYFIAGVLKRIRELNILFNSTINSYKRLVPGHEAPTKICWGTKNRSVLIRVPHFNRDQASAARAEIRSPDVLCNPYLALAALLKSGLEGIKAKEPITPVVEECLYCLDPEEMQARNLPSLPSSLGQALENLKESKLAQELLGQQLIDEFVSLKEKELSEFNSAVTNWEIARYL